jgi:hypothetical protein
MHHYEFSLALTANSAVFISFFYSNSQWRLTVVPVVLFNGQTLFYGIEWNGTLELITKYIVTVNLTRKASYLVKPHSPFGSERRYPYSTSQFHLWAFAFRMFDNYFHPQGLGKKSIN